ncbi:MAG: YraN family protein [Candidatus Wildermuthbacteria bacterium]|nr:YraN family protein [Candidatus Wildermuthbacteria bacterium]
MAEHNQLGQAGEEAAKVYLQSKGYIIMQQNRKTKRGEIDIIAKHRQWLVFVEVRARGAGQSGTPEETINRSKKQKLLRNAQSHIFFTGYKGLYRVDAVCIVFDGPGSVQRLTHYENIVEDPLF